MVSFTPDVTPSALFDILFEIEANTYIWLIWRQRFDSNQLKLVLCSIVEVFDGQKIWVS